MCVGRQPERTNKINLGGKPFPPPPARMGVERVTRRDHRDDATRAEHVDTASNRQVVQIVSVRVVHPRLHRRKRDVAHHQVVPMHLRSRRRPEIPSLQPGFDHIAPGQQPSDTHRDRINVHRVKGHRPRCVTHPIPSTAPRFERVPRTNPVLA